MGFDPRVYMALALVFAFGMMYYGARIALPLIAIALQ
jgi:hypothetical protein